MELNDHVKVILTQRGADILNTINANYKKQLPTYTWMTDYKAGDTYRTELWNLFTIFGPFAYYGAHNSFTNLEYDR